MWGGGKTEGGQNGILKGKTGREGGIRVVEKMGGRKNREIDEERRRRGHEVKEMRWMTLFEK